MTLKLRVALQGGGAKLAMLIAAADVLQELEKEKVIKVTQVSGTSAGSIVACMLASGKPIEEYRLKVIDAGKVIIDDVSKIPGDTKLAWKFYWAQPVFPPNSLRNFMYGIFGEKLKLKDLQIPAHVVVSNVRHRTKKILVNSDDFVADIVTTSSALPLAFRTYKQSDLYVDGGLVSNFPAEELIQNNPDQDSLLGFSFKALTEDEPDSLKSYVGALVSTAIESNVEHNAKRIKELGGEICLLDTDLKTLDFQKALDALDTTKNAYGRMKAQAKLEVLAKVKLLAERSNAMKRSAGESIDKKFSRIHASLKNEFPYEIVKSTTLIIAQGLQSKVESTSDDEIRIDAKFQTKPPNNKVFAIKIGIPASGIGMPLTNEKDDLAIYGPSGTQLSTTTQIIEEESGYYAVLILDKPAVLKTGENVNLHLRVSVRDAMVELKEFGRAAIRQAGSKENTYTREILIALPKELGQPVLVDLLEQIPLMQNEGLAYTKEEMSPVWAKGRELNKDEINASRQKIGMRLTPEGHNLCGWRTKLGPDQYCGVCVQVAKQK